MKSQYLERVMKPIEPRRGCCVPKIEAASRKIVIICCCLFSSRSFAFEFECKTTGETYFDYDKFGVHDAYARLSDVSFRYTVSDLGVKLKVIPRWLIHNLKRSYGNLTLAPLTLTADGSGCDVKVKTSLGNHSF